MTIPKIVINARQKLCVISLGILVMASVTGSGAHAQATAPKVDLEALRKNAAALLPTGTLNVGMDVNYAPFEFYDADGKTILGADAELARAVGEAMNVSITFVPMSFSNVIPSLLSRRIDVGWSGITAYKLLEERVDFVMYVENKMTVLVQKGNPANVKSLADLCGLKVATGRTTAHWIAMIAKQSEACVAAGKPPLQMLQFGSSQDVDLAVRSGRADASLNSFPQASRASQVVGAGAVEVATPPLPLSPVGVVVPKGSPLAPLLQQAFQHVHAQGAYKAILERHDLLKCCERTDFSINGARL
ncbi:ABC transporter substrate-binding protein [soil metagenome]